MVAQIVPRVNPLPVLRPQDRVRKDTGGDGFDVAGGGHHLLLHAFQGRVRKVGTNLCKEQRERGCRRGSKELQQDAKKAA